MYHISRQPESVIYKDRDILTFIPDALVEDSDVITMHTKDGGDLICQVGTSDAPLVGERVLLYGRAGTDADLMNGLRICTYIDSGTTAKPFREVINPKVTYDKNSNVLVMWFWTNFIQYPGDDIYTDDPAYLKYIVEDAFTDETGLVKVLCCATGSMQYVYVEGGLVSTYGEDGMDIMPIFRKPIIVQDLTIPYEVGGEIGVPIADVCPQDIQICINKSGETIPNNAVLMPDGYDSSGALRVIKPTMDNAPVFLINDSREIEAEKVFGVKKAYPKKVYYSGSGLIYGGDLGTENGSWDMKKGNRGVKAVAISSTEAACRVLLKEFPPPVYKAMADASGGQIAVKAVNADGTTTGDTIYLKVLP